MTEVMEKTAQVKLKTSTKLNLIIGMISVLFIGAAIFNFAFLTRPVSVTLPEQKTDVVSPYITITFPRNGELVSGEINIEAFAYDDQQVKNVSFYLNNTLKEIDDNEKDGWTMTWDTRTSPDGTDVLKALVTDTGDNASVSKPVTVVVKNKI